jgi:hypothetical protein
MQFHPLANLLPMFDGPQWAEFVASIKDKGQLDPIVTHDGMILDGRHRYRACVELGMAPAFVEFQGDDALGFVIAKNVHRRQLSAKQRAAFAAELANLKVGKPKDAGKEIGQICPISSVSLDEAAKLMNVSRRSVVSAKKRMHDDPEAHAAVKAGHKPPARTTPTADEQAAGSRQIQQMALDRGISWAHKGEAISKAVRGATGQKILRTVDITNPTTVQVVSAVLDDFANRSLEDRYQEHRAEVATLPESAQQKLERLAAKEIQLRSALFEQEVRDEARRRLPDEQEALRAAKERAHAEFKKYAAMRKGIAAQLSADDYRFLLNILHPDRAPPDRAEKFARAFDIVRQLDAYIEAFNP